MADLFVWKPTSQQQNSWHVLEGLEGEVGVSKIWPAISEEKKRFIAETHQKEPPNLGNQRHERPVVLAISKFGVVSAAETALGRNCDFRLNILALSMMIRIARPWGYLVVQVFLHSSTRCKVASCMGCPKLVDDPHALFTAWGRGYRVQDLGFRVWGPGL